MNEPFFCSAAAQQASEALIGTAGHYQTYVLIECPKPWPAIAFNSPAIPASLRQYIDALSADKTVRFLCIDRGLDRGLTELSAQTTLLIYEQNNLSDSGSSDSFTSGYCGYEFRLDNLEQVISCLETYWQEKLQLGTARQKQAQKIQQQDVLVCTHGMRDRCCAKWGRPLFKGAKRLVDNGSLPNTRVWQASHIGGHRFAPTAITLPDGRYYGRLSLSTLRSIIRREGAIDRLDSVYRGWSVLPRSLQLVEANLLLENGWSWLDRSVAYQQLGAEGDEAIARLFVRQLDDHIVCYRARVVRDDKRTYSGKKSCGDDSPSTIAKYAVADCAVEKAPALQD